MCTTIRLGHWRGEAVLAAVRRGGRSRCRRSRTRVRRSGRVPGVMTWSHQPVEGRDAGAWLAAAEDSGAADVPGGQVGPGALALVLVLDPHRRGRVPGGTWGAASAGLDAGLLVGRDHVVVRPQRLALPDAVVEVEDSARPSRRSAGRAGRSSCDGARVGWRPRTASARWWSPPIDGDDPRRIDLSR